MSISLPLFHARGHAWKQGWLFVPLLLLTTFSGCRTGTDLLEAELRGKERQVDDLRAELANKDLELRVLEREIEQLQRRSLQAGAEPSSSPYVVKSIALGRLTGGCDAGSGQPGDDALQVLLEPRDVDDQAIKAPGTLHVEVFEVSPEGVKSHLSAWDVSARELRRTWQTPVFGQPAYRVILPWTILPKTAKLRVVAQFTTLDGRKFEADRDVNIRLVDAPRRESTRPP